MAEGSDIEISIEFGGQDEARTGTLALASAISQLSDKVASLGQKEAVVKTETELMAEAAKKAADAQRTAATNAIALGQRLQGVAMAVQSLTAQFGGQSRTAGLIGASISTSVQFAQLGLMLGPQGALVGGIIGAAIPALSLLREEMAVSTSTIDDTARSLEDLTAAYVATREAAELSVRLAEGTQTLAEAQDSATEAQARYDDEAMRHQTLLRQSLDAAERESASRSEALDLLIPGYRAMSILSEDAVTNAQAELDASVALTTQLREEAEARTKVAEEMQRQVDAQAHLERQVRVGNDHNADRSRIRRREADHTSAFDLEASGLEGALARQAEAQRIAAEQQAELTEKENTLLEEQLEYRERLATHAEEQAQQAARLHAAQLQFHEEEVALELDRAEQAKAKAAEHSQAISENMSETFGNIISSMTDVIAQMAEGNATAEEGAKLMLASFLQAMSQRAQIEALAQVAQAVGSYPDVAGIAAHLAGALAWGAVAVATGVGGAALSSDVSKAQAARAEAAKEQDKPASPRGASAAGGRGGGDTVVNFNGPVMTASARADFGRMLNELGSEGRQRHPGM